MLSFPLVITALLASSVWAENATESRRSLVGFPAVLLNCGGTAYVDSLGRQWSEDKYFTGGYTFQSNIPVANTLDDTLYNCERYGQSVYSIPAPPGSYTVVLHFAEIYHSAVGKRVFDIDVEGQTVADFDIVKIGRSVAFKAIKRTVTPVSVWDGFLTIQFFDNMPLIDFPKISAIEVIQLSATPTTPSTKAPVVLPTKAPVKLTPAPKAPATKAPVKLTPAPKAPVTITPAPKAPVKLTSAPKAPVKLTLAPKAPVTITPAPKAPVTITKPLAVRINCGAKVPYVDSLGRTWSADSFFTGGYTYDSAVAIADTVDDSLYNCERYGHTTYAVPVPPGIYSVTLHYAEIYYVSAGARVFDVCVENVDLPDIDIVKLGGGVAFKAVTTVMKNVLVNDGLLTIDFKDNKPQVDFPKISAIEIIQEKSLAPVGPPVVVTTKAPAAVVTKAPVVAVTKAPVVATKAPVVAVTKAPVMLPVSVPTAPKASPIVTKAPVVAGLFTPVRINCGGVAYTDTKGRVWSADKSFTGGYAYGANLVIADTDDDPLYSSERYGTAIYNIAVPSGAYNVVLHFAEIYYTAAGKRIFDVSIESNRLEDFDIVKTGGGLAFKAITRFIPYVMVTDGFLTIQLHDNVPLVDFPKISAIEINPSNSSPIVAPKTPVAVTKAPAVATKAPVVRVTKAPVVATKAPVVRITKAPVVATKAPVVRITKAPVVATKAPVVRITKAPVVATKAPVVRITKAPKAPTKAPAAAPVRTWTPILINCGGGDYVDPTGRTWMADRYFVGGKVYDCDIDVMGSPMDAVYNSERYGNAQYQIPVPAPGKYNVTIHLAEIFHTAVGDRVFDLRVEASTRADVDIVKLGGGVSFKAVTVQFTAVNVSDGFVTIDLMDNVPLIDFPKISGIEIHAMPF